MAGSLNHIIAPDGGFCFDLIENLGDAYEACEECFDVIARLCDGDLAKLQRACMEVRATVPDVLPEVGKRSDFPSDAL